MIGMSIIFIPSALPAPAKCRMSSVVSSSMTSKTSSTVITPNKCPSLSITGIAIRLYFDTVPATFS